MFECGYCVLAKTKLSMSKQIAAYLGSSYSTIDSAGNIIFNTRPQIANRLRMYLRETNTTTRYLTCIEFHPYLTDNDIAKIRENYRQQAKKPNLSGPDVDAAIDQLVAQAIKDFKPEIIIHKGNLISDPQMQSEILAYVMLSPFYSQDLYGRTIEDMSAEWSGHDFLNTLFTYAPAFPDALERTTDINCERGAGWWGVVF